MRIVILGNNWVAWQIASWLKSQGEDIVALVLHPPGKRKFGDGILETLKDAAVPVFDGTRLRQTEVLDELRLLQPVIGLSLFFDYILRPEFLDLFSAGVVNLHPSYLPHNRGQYPNVWSIIEHTPSGVTLHYLDEGIDTGDIIAQREVAVAPIDTGKSLYRKLESASVELFKDWWPLLKANQAPRQKQPASEGVAHRTKDVEKVDAIDLDRSYPARTLIDLIRARTFPPYGGAYFEENGRRIYLRLELLYEEDLGKTQFYVDEH